MNTYETPISRRLQQIADYVTTGARLLDIGTDHAYLPVFLAEKGLIHHAIAGELNQGPYHTALKHVEKMGLQKLVDVRRGSGFSVLRPDDQVTDVVLAGMGGRLIVEILEEGRRFLPQIKRLVLQPNVGQHLVRKWLFENGWRLLDEAILKEAGRIYEVMSAEPGVETRYPPDADEREWLFRLGPVLLNKKPPLLREKWIKESAKWKRMAQNMALSEDPEVKQKRHQLLEEIQSLEGRLICMQKDRP